MGDLLQTYKKKKYNWSETHYLQIANAQFSSILGEKNIHIYPVRFIALGNTYHIFLAPLYNEFLFFKHNHKIGIKTEFSVLVSTTQKKKKMLKGAHFAVF